MGRSTLNWSRRVLTSVWLNALKKEQKPFSYWLLLLFSKCVANLSFWLKLFSCQKSVHSKTCVRFGTLSCFFCASTTILIIEPYSPLESQFLVIWVEWLAYGQGMSLWLTAGQSKYSIPNPTTVIGWVPDLMKAGQSGCLDWDSLSSF